MKVTHIKEDANPSRQDQVESYLMAHTGSLTPDNFAVHTLQDFEIWQLALKKTVTA